MERGKLSMHAKGSKEEKLTGYNSIVWLNILLMLMFYINKTKTSVWNFSITVIFSTFKNTV